MQRNLHNSRNNIIQRKSGQKKNQKKNPIRNKRRPLYRAWSQCCPVTDAGALAAFSHQQFLFSPRVIENKWAPLFSLTHSARRICPLTFFIYFILFIYYLFIYYIFLAFLDLDDSCHFESFSNSGQFFFTPPRRKKNKVYMCQISSFWFHIHPWVQQEVFPRILVFCRKGLLLTSMLSAYLTHMQP